MTTSQLFAGCVLVAPNFRIGIEYPVQGRSMVWRGRPAASLTELSAGILFPDGSAFEPKFAFLLEQALAQLQAAR